MIKKTLWLMSSLGIGLLIITCSDAEKSESKPDMASGQDQGNNFFFDDGGEILQPISQDAGKKTDGIPIPQCSPAKKATSNSGKVCDPTKSECSSGETCFLFEQQAKLGMCLGKCCRDFNDPQAEANFCPGHDSNKQIYSPCDIVLTTSNQMACDFYCWAKDNEGKEYNFNLPASLDPTKYECKSSANPNVKIWAPKQQN